MIDLKHIPVLKLLVTIVDREITQKVIDIYRDKQVKLHFVCIAAGTAGSEISDVLGLGSVDKAIVICLEPNYRTSELLSAVSEKMQLHKPGKGIAFSLPLSGINNPIVQMFNKDSQLELEKELEKQVENIKNTCKYDLIVAVINQGHSDELMESAREAGATGGTVMHARRISTDEAVSNFLGISMQAEKEIVAILTKHENKTDIMKAVCHSSGLKTEAMGIVLSLPVDDIEGLGEAFKK